MSMTISGLLVMVLGMVLKAVGIPFITEDLEKAVTIILELVGLVVAWIGRYRQGDVNLVGIKH